jgi:hypothetical protein
MYITCDGPLLAFLGPSASSASRPALRERRITLAPPMRLHLRHSFEGIILGFACGRKRLWRSTVRLKAITDRPDVSALSLRVRLNPEREQRNLLGHDWRYGAWQFNAKVYPHRNGHLLASVAGVEILAREPIAVLCNEDHAGRLSKRHLGVGERLIRGPRQLLYM